MALVVYNHSNPFTDKLKLPNRHFSFVKRDEASNRDVVLEIVIEQEWAPGGRGGTLLGFGASVYDGAIVLGYYLEKNINLVMGKRVIELGSGPGLCGIVASALGADFTLVTDGDDVSVSLAKRNITANIALQESCVSAKLLWGDEEGIQAAVSEGLFDVLLAADVAALPYAEAFDSLIYTMKKVLRPGGLVIFCEQRRNEIEERFMQLIKNQFSVVEIDKKQKHADFVSNENIKIYLATPLLCPLSLHVLLTPTPPSLPPLHLPAIDLSSLRHGPSFPTLSSERLLLSLVYSFKN